MHQLAIDASAIEAKQNAVLTDKQGDKPFEAGLEKTISSHIFPCNKVPVTINVHVVYRYVPKSVQQPVCVLLKWPTGRRNAEESWTRSCQSAYIFRPDMNSPILTRQVDCTLHTTYAEREVMDIKSSQHHGSCARHCFCGRHMV